MSMPVRWQMQDLIDEHQKPHRANQHTDEQHIPICDACLIKERVSSILHGHQHFIMTLVVRGDGIQTLNGEDISFVEDDLFLLSPADFHSNTLPAGKSFDYYRLCFSYELLDARLSGIFAPDRLPLYLHLSADTAALAKDIFAKLVDESENGQERAGHRVYLQALAEQLLILVMREMAPSQVSQPSTPVNRALGYLHAHFHEPISVGDAAAYAGYTPNYFNYCFRNQMGIPFGEYLRNMRLTYAENLLRSSAIPVTEIAFESGFGSLSHFSRSFREKYGCAPQEYRRKLQNDNNE